MPNNILITPGSASIQFSGSADNTIRLQVEQSGSVAFYGNSGSLFSITDQLSGSLMSVNDISGLPILEVFSDNRVVMGTFNQNTLVVTGSRVGIDKAVPTTDLDISGSVFITGSLSFNLGGITGSLLGTSSWANNSISSSLATSASFATTSSFSVSSSRSVTASFVQTAISSSFPFTVVSGSLVSATAQTTGVVPSSSIVLGQSAGIRLQRIGTSIADNHIVIGTNALDSASLSSGANGIFIGTAVATASRGLIGDIVIGNRAGEVSEFGSSGITAIGSQAFSTSTGSGKSVSIGPSAHTLTKSPGNAVAIGWNAGSSGFNNTDSVDVGVYAGESAPSGSFKVNVGAYAGQRATLGRETINIGWYAGERTFASSQSINIGPNAGAITSGSALVVNLGYGAGYNSYSPFSINIGAYAGSPLTTPDTTSSNNIVIGNGIAAPSNTKNFLNIGGILFATGIHFGNFLSDPNRLTSSLSNVARVGILNPFPNYVLDVSGSGNFTNGLTVTGSLLATASWANNAISASWAPGGAGLSGGTLNYIPLWTGASTLSSSLVYQTQSSIIIGTSSFYTPTAPDALAVHQLNTASFNAITTRGTVNNYFQLNIQNLSGGNSASSDIVATANNGSETSGYVDMGINSSGYVNNGNGIGFANDAYLYTQGAGNLLIGNTATDKKIILFTGGGNAIDNARVYIDETGSVGINTSATTTGNPEALLVSALADSYNLISGRANINNYSQLNIINLNGGSSASADVVATANNGTETTNYIDMGINSDQFGIINAVGGPNDAYLYSTGNDLHIGNTTAGKHIRFFAGDFDSDASAKLTLEANNQHTLSGSLSVTGSISVLENVINTLTASFAVSASFAPTILPAGIVSSSVQINTGSFSGSFRGTLIGTSSWATNAVSASYALPSFIDNLVTVGLAGSNTNFTSIKAAVDSITDASAANTYTVRVYPGVYIEDTITLKPYIAIKGDSSVSTIVSASNPNNTIFVMADQTMVIDMQIQGSTGTNASAIVYSSPTTPQTNAIAYAENIRFGTNYTNAKVVGSGSSGNCILQCSNVKYGGFTSGSKSFDVGFYVTSGSDGGIGRMQLRNVTSTNGGVAGTDDNQIFALADAPGCTFIVNGCLLTRATGTARGTGFKVYNGGQLRLTGVNFQRWIRGIWAPQTGSAPSIDAIALNFENCTTDVAIEHSGSIGKVQGTDTFLKTQINFSSSLYEVGKDARRIRVAKKGGDFTSISASVAYITDSSETNRYVIEVGPGQYTENTIDLTGKPYVSIVGSNIQTTQIFASSSTQHIVKMGINNEISFLTLANAGSGYAAIYVDDVGDFAQAHKISIYDSDIGVQVVSRTQDTQFYGEYIDINGPFSYGTYVSASNNALCLVNMENYYLFPSASTSIGNYVTHPSASLSMHSATMQGDNTANSVAIQLESGAQIEGSGIDIQDWDYGIKIPNIGTGPNFRLVGTMIHGSSTYDIENLNTTTRGRFQGVSNHTLINNVSQDLYWNFLDDEDGENDVTRKLSVTFADGTHTDATTLIFKGSSMGVLEGGTITTSSGFTVTTAAGYGYLHDPVDTTVFKRFDWVDSNITLTANSTNYLFINSSGVLSAASSTPNFAQNIILGRVVTNNTGVEFIEQSSWNAEHTANRLSKFTRQALGPVYADGSIVSENAVPFKLNVTAGNYYFAENNFLPSGTSSINLTQYYPSASTWARYTSSVVPNNTYASSSALVPMSASAYTKHTVYLVGQGVDEKYFLVINSNQYATLVEAENASLPTTPTYFDDAVVPLAAVYVRSGSATITQIQDIRPIIGFRAAGVNASSIHGNLLGLSADDHPQYLLVNGTRAMTGNLSLGGNNITNVGTMFGTASFATTASYAVSASYAPSVGGGLTTKAGSVANTSFTGNPRKATVTFAAAFPNTSYAVVVTGEDARTWTIENKLAGSFVISANSNVGLTGTTYWVATAYGES